MKTAIIINTIDELNFMAKSIYPTAKTAQILINLAMNFIREDERTKLLSESKIINPFNGKPIKKIANG